MARRRTNEKKEDPVAAEQPRFEEGMERLEGVIARMESGELALEDALKAFEEGVALVRLLNEKLTEAEQRIEILSRTDDGRLELRAAEEDEP